MKILLAFFLSLNLFSQTYSRSQFGDGWSMYKGCISVRERVLIVQSVNPTVLDATRCKIVSGTWRDPYTGKTFKDPSNVDIDHVVPLKWAWTHGASSWTRNKRISFANFVEDPKHLLAAEKKVNASKSDSGPDRWLPTIDRCTYVLNFDRIVKKWDLKYSLYEKNKIEELKKNNCKKQ